MLKDIVKSAFIFEMNGSKVNRLIYKPYMYEYLIENTIDFRKDVADILIKTKFNELIQVCPTELYAIVERLPFNKKIIFDYRNRVIEHD